MLRQPLKQIIIFASFVCLVMLAFIFSMNAFEIASWQQSTRRLETALPTATKVRQQSLWMGTPTPIPRFAAMNPMFVEAQYEGRLLPNGTILPPVWSPPIGAYIPQEGVRRLSAPTATISSTPSNTPTLTLTSTPTATNTFTPSMTPSRTPTATHSPTSSSTPLPPTVTLVFLSPSPTPSTSPTPITPTPTYTPSNTYTPTPTYTFTYTPTSTSTPTHTNTPDRTRLARELGPTIVAYDESDLFTGCAPRGFPVAGVLTKIYSASHRGIDLGVYVGTSVDATHSGVVTYAGWSSIGYGYLVVIQSGAYSTYYAHLSEILVEVGQSVTFGQVIALSGSTGNSSGPHVHYEVRVNDIEIDPFIFESLQVIRC